MSTPSTVPTNVIECMTQAAGRLADLADTVESYTPSAGGDADPAFGAVLLSRMKEAAQAMDAEATKLTVAFSSNPVSLGQTYPLCERFLGTAFVLTDLWHKSKPETVGRCLFKLLKMRTIALFTAARAFCAALVEAKGKAIKENGRGWIGVAELSDAAQKFVELPGSNLEAVRALLARSASVLQDGYNELLEAVEEHKASSATAASALASGPSSADGESASREGDDGDDEGDDDDETWTAAEFALMPNVLGGIKVACNAITKTADLLGTMGGIASNPDAVDAMPDIADAMCAISDDFVLACYGSVDLVELNRNAVLLRTRSEELLSLDRKLLAGVDGDGAAAELPKWLPMLERAAEHNQVKLRATSDAGAA